jgi:hypothetical protein
MTYKRQVKISYISFITSESLLHSDIRKSNSEPANQARREGGKDFLDTLYILNGLIFEIQKDHQDITETECGSVEHSFFYHHLKLPRI